MRPYPNHKLDYMIMCISQNGPEVNQKLDQGLGKDRATGLMAQHIMFENSTDYSGITNLKLK